MRKPVVGVMGPGQAHAKAIDLEIAQNVGACIARQQAILLCGGMAGVMEAAARGAVEHGGVVVGIGPTEKKTDQNNHVTIPIMTGMGAGRNFMNVLSSDALVFISVRSPGTLSELAYAIQKEVPSLVVNHTPALETLVGDLGAQNVEFFSNVDTLLAQIEERVTSIAK